MSNRRSSPKRKSRSPYLFALLCALLLTALAAVGATAMNTWNVYAAEAAVTPTPSPTVRPVSVTPDPNRATPTPTPVPTPTATPAPTATPGVLKSGSKGDAVKGIQERLQTLGYYSGKIDGDFGSGTKAAVQAFQEENGLEADGVVGAKTLSVLYGDSAVPRPDPVDTLAGDIPLLVNKWNTLPASFEPAGLVNVKEKAGSLMTYEKDSIQAVGEAVDALIAMIRDAENDGYSPWKLREAYRTVADQQKIFNSRVKSYENAGNTHAQALSITRREVADPGASEHHTGLAFDLNVPGKTFAETSQYIWLKKHCWDYGFIMRYTDEKDEITGITGEEWHIRYVGVEHAQAMRDMDYCLEEYVAYLKGQ